MMYYLGIDPGVKKSAFCVIDENKELGDIGFFESSVEGLNDFYWNYFPRRAKETIHWKLILEKPDRVDKKSTLRDILNLMQVVGRIEYCLRSAKPIVVSAVQWKGQTPKEVTRKRVQNAIPGIRDYININAESTRHNLYDAAGLALYGLKASG